MQRFGALVRDSDIGRLITAILTAVVITTGSFSPLLIQGTGATAIALPHPLPVPKPNPQLPYRPPLSEEFPDPGPCYGDCSHVLDPSVFYEDGVYWRFTTSNNISVAAAPSLSGPWRYKGSLLHEGTTIFVVEDQDIWVNIVLASSEPTY